MTNSSGTIVWQQSFDPYGVPTTLVNTTSADFGYAGYYVHQRSGLNLTATRAYSASLGRFINRDPIGESGGVNLYGYVDGNPISFADPSGLLKFCLSAACNAKPSPPIPGPPGGGHWQCNGPPSGAPNGGPGPGNGGPGNGGPGNGGPGNGDPGNGGGPAAAAAFGLSKLTPQNQGHAVEAGLRQLGYIGEKVAIDTPNGVIRPDGLTDTEVQEVKWKTTQINNTQQLRSYFQYAQATGRQFVLWVQQGWTASAPLRAQIQAGAVQVEEVAAPIIESIESAL
jgi:RHS repeat-associated protein